MHLHTVQIFYNYKVDKFYIKWANSSGQEKGVVFVEILEYELVRAGHMLYERTDFLAALSI